MSDSKIARRVAQIKNAINRTGLSFREVSRKTGVPLATLAPIGRDDWNPTLSTLLKLEDAMFNKSAKGKS